MIYRVHTKNLTSSHTSVTMHACPSMTDILVLKLGHVHVSFPRHAVGCTLNVPLSLKTVSCARPYITMTYILFSIDVVWDIVAHLVLCHNLCVYLFYLSVHGYPSYKVLLYPRHTKYVGVYSFRFSVRPFVRTFVRSYVRSFVCSSFRHRVKVFALKFIRPHILKTLWWILFIYGMMVDIGLKFLSAPSPPRGDLGNKVTDFEFL